MNDEWNFLSCNLSWWQLISFIYLDLLNCEVHQAQKIVDFSYGIFFYSKWNCFFTEWKCNSLITLIVFWNASKRFINQLLFPIKAPNQMRSKDRGGRRSSPYRDSYYGGGDHDRRRNRRRSRSRSPRSVLHPVDLIADLYYEIHL